MIEQIDQQLFMLINSHNSPFWDNVMYFLSMKLVWAPLYLVILIYLGSKYRRKFTLILLVIIIAIILSDQISVLIKNSVDRLRPCHDPALQGLIHLVNGQCGSIYGFVSSHAANAFNVAFLSLMFIKKRWYSVSILIWAVLISYSRIYLGVHYPADVFFGAILGSLIGWVMYKAYELTDKKIN